MSMKRRARRADEAFPHEDTSAAELGTGVGAGQTVEFCAGSQSIPPVLPTSPSHDAAAHTVKEFQRASRSVRYNARKRTVRGVLRDLLGSGKLLITSHRLPVVVTWFTSRGEFSVSWDQTSVLARSAQESIAEDVQTAWAGLLVQGCFTIDASSDDCRPADAPAVTSAISRELYDELMSNPRHQLALTELLRPMGAHPIFLSSTALYHTFDSFVHLVLRPMLHNVVEASTDHVDPVEFTERVDSGFAAMEQVTEEIASAILKMYEPGDAMWFHDYHVALVAEEVSKRLASRPPMVLFMHSPFPASEVLRCMSFRSKLLQAMLANDVIAFHTFPHARHFLQACRRILGLPCQSQQGGRLSISCRGGRSVMVAINHVGIEKFALIEAMVDPAAAIAASQIRSKHPNKVILFGLGDSDRLAGIALQLLAYEKFLEEHSSYPKSVVLLQKVEVVGEGLRDDSLLQGNRIIVDRIRTKFGADVIDYEEAPSYSRPVRTALFYCCDVLLHTPVQEGLNLLPLEYAYCRLEWSRVAEESNPLSLLHGGDPAAHIAAIEKELLRQSRAANSSDVSLPSIGEHDDFGLCLDEDGCSLPEPDAPLPRSMLVPSRSNALLSQFAPHLVMEEEHAPTHSVRFVMPSQETSLTIPLPRLGRLGVVVLSEFCIAAQIMNSHIAVNPWNIDGVAEAIEKALLMEDEDRLTRHLRDLHYTSRSTYSDVSKRILLDLLQLRRSDRIVFTDLDCGGFIHPLRAVTVSTSEDAELSPLDVASVLHSFANSKKRVILLDYDGALIPQNSISWFLQSQFSSPRHGNVGDPDAMTLPPSVVSQLYTLAGSSSTMVYVLSATRVAAVDGSLLRQLESVDISAGESSQTDAHNQSASSDDSAYASETPDSEDNTTFQGNPLRTYPQPKLTELQVPPGWSSIKTEIVAIMNEYRWRVAGSRVIVSDSCVAWDFRLSEADWAVAQAKFLAQKLSESFESPLVKVSRRAHQVDVMLRNFGIGTALYELIRVINDAEFVLAIGNDTNDEEMFKTLQDLLERGSEVTPLGFPAEMLSSSAMSPFAFGLNGPKRPDKHVFTLTIGRRQTNARYYVDSVKDVHGLLSKLAAAESRRRRAGSLTKSRSKSGSSTVLSAPPNAASGFSKSDSVEMLSTVNSALSMASEGSGSNCGMDGDGSTHAGGDVSSSFFHSLLQPSAFSFGVNTSFAFADMFTPRFPEG